jgi:hypothetical protein
MDKFHLRISKLSTRNCKFLVMNPQINKNHSYIIRNKLYNTYPCLVHCPNIKNSLNKFPNLIFLNHFLNQPLHNVNSEQYTIIFYNNGKDSLLQKSIQRWSISNLLHLGYGHIWRRDTQKLDLIISSFSKIKTEFFFFLDSYDVILCGDLIQAIRQLELKKCDALYNAETAQFPLNFCTTLFERSVVDGGNMQCFLNAGVSVWRTSFFREMLTELSSLDFLKFESEQGIIKLLYQKYFPRIQIDSKSESFQVISPPNWGVYMRPHIEVLC